MHISLCALWLWEHAGIRSASRTVILHLPLPESELMSFYVRAGMRFGALYASGEGRDSEREVSDLRSLVDWERAYARRGFRPIGLEAWKTYAREHRIDMSRVSEKRLTGEPALMHASRALQERTPFHLSS